MYIALSNWLNTFNFILLQKFFQCYQFQIYRFNSAKEFYLTR